MGTAPVGRLAPSPSGQMHLGNAFSALLCWLSVRSAGGRLILRLEDLDPQRCREEFCRQVETDLCWLGLDWDAGGMADGDHYRQSCRGDYYARILARLREQGRVYPCYCSRGQLHAASAPHASDGTFLYPGTCRELTEEERQSRQRAIAPRCPALRIQTPNEKIEFVDGLQGAYVQNLARDCGDFILRRSDGVFAYQLAVVADDGAMGVTEVVRGRDLLSSTPRQLWLHRLLGQREPAFYHVPLLTAPDGRRLSKRDGDLKLAALRDAGKKPEAVVGWLACQAGLLDRPEPVRPEELVANFSWEKVRREDIAVYPERDGKSALEREREYRSGKDQSAFRKTGQNAFLTR